LKVVRSPACPILIVRVAEDRPYDTVLSAVDLREGCVRAASLAVDLFPVAHHHLLYALGAAPGSTAWAAVLAGSNTCSMNHSMRRPIGSCSSSPSACRLAQGMLWFQSSPTTCRRGRSWLVPGQGTSTDSFLGSMAQHVIYAALGDVLVVP
jgi:hypothetical protein